MDKLRRLPFISFFSNFIRQMKSEDMNPNFAWRVIVVVSIIVAGVISVGAYFMLDWAESVDQAPPTTQKGHDALSPQDLHAIVQIYEAKANTYADLHQHRPIAPNLKANVKVPVSDAGNATTSDVGTPTISQ